MFQTVRDSLAGAVRRGIAEGRIDVVYVSARMLARAALCGHEAAFDASARRWRPTVAMRRPAAGEVDNREVVR